MTDYPEPSPMATEVISALVAERDRYKAALEESENDGDAVAQQRDDLRARLDRIRAAAESDPVFQVEQALRDFLLRETEPGVLHVPGVSGAARTDLTRNSRSASEDSDDDPRAESPHTEEQVWMLLREFNAAVAERDRYKAALELVVRELRERGDGHVSAQVEILVGQALDGLAGNAPSEETP